MRQMAAEALDQAAGPVHQCVQQVYTYLLNAARYARAGCRGWGRPGADQGTIAWLGRVILPTGTSYRDFLQGHSSYSVVFDKQPAPSHK